VTLPRPAKAPCYSCPYRRDVAAGIWHPDEYAKLPTYDGDTGEQIMKGGIGLFFCHQRDGKLCAGWVGCHDTVHLAALRFNRVDPATYDYESPVPLFASGAEAAEHGMSGVDNPDPKAKAAILRLLRKAQRNRP
jgi:hypothetical protein